MAIADVVAKSLDAVNGDETQEYEDFTEYLSPTGTFELYAFSNGVEGVINLNNIPLGGPGSDTTAIHVNVPGEINAQPLKALPVSADVITGEDSENGFSPVKFNLTQFLAAAGEVNTASNLPGGVGVFSDKFLLDLRFFPFSSSQFENVSSVIQISADGITQTELATGSVGGDQIMDDSVSNTELANMATQTIKGRNAVGTGDPEDLAPATVVNMLGLDDAVQLDQSNQFTTAPLLSFNSGHKILIENDAGGTKGYIDAGSLTAGGGGEINTAVARGGGLVIADSTTLPNSGSQIPVRTLNTSQFSETSDLISIAAGFQNLGSANQSLTANRTVDGSDSFTLDFTSINQVSIDGDEIATLAATQSLTNKFVNGVNLVSTGDSANSLREDGSYLPAGGAGLAEETFPIAAGETGITVGKFGLLNNAGEFLLSNTSSDERLSYPLEVTAVGATVTCKYRQITVNGLNWNPATNGRVGLLGPDGHPQAAVGAGEKAESFLYFIRDSGANSIWADIRSHVPLTQTTATQTYPYLIDAAGSTGLADDPNLVDGNLYYTEERDNTSGGNGAGVYRFVSGASDTADEGLIVTHPNGRLYIVRTTDQRTDAWWYPGQDADPAEWDWADRCNQYLQSTAVADQTAQPARVVWVPEGVLIKRTIDVNQYQPDGTTVLAGTNIRFEGEGSQQSLIELAASLTTIGINALRADEFSADGFKMIEASGSKTSTLLAGGGTTLRISNCWFAGAYAGVEVAGSAGGVIHDNIFENCDRELHIGTRYSDSTRGYDTTGPTSRVVSHLRVVNNQFSKGTCEVIQYSQMTCNTTTGTLNIGETITDSVTQGTALIIDAWGADASRVVVVRKVESDTMGESNAFTSDGGDSGTITTIQSSTMDDVRLVGNTFNGDHETTHGDKPKLTIEAGSNIVVDNQFTDSDATSAPVVSITDTLGYRFGGVLSMNTTGAEISGGHGVVTGLISNGPFSGSSHGEDLAVRDSSCKLTGNHFGNTGAYVVGGVGDIVEQSATGMRTQNACLDFNGTDVSVTAALSSFFTGSLQVTVSFILVRKPTKAGCILAQGASATNAWQIHYLSGALQFEVVIAGTANRVVINDPVMLGKYSVTFLGGGPVVVVTKPNGDIESTLVAGVAVHTGNDGTLHIGQRPDTNANFFTDACVTQIELIDNSAALVHEYRGFGAENEFWRDLVPTATVNGVVNGASPQPVMLAISPSGGLEDTRNEWHEAQRYAVKTQSSIGGTLRVNAASGSPEVAIVLTENINPLRVVNVFENQTVTLNIIQAAAGGPWNVTFDSAIQGTPPTINQGAGEPTFVQIKGVGSSGTPYFAASPV